MQQRGEETRNKILEASIKLFSARGFNAASVDDICEEAGVSKGAFYHHFTSKQELFLALLELWLQTIDRAIETAQGKTVPEVFLQVADAFPYIFQTAHEGLPMFLEFWMQASRNPKIRRASVRSYRRYHDLFAGLIRQGVEEGSFVEVDPDLTSRMIISTAMGMLLQSLLDPQGAPWEKVARDSANMLTHSLLRQSNKRRIS